MFDISCSQGRKTALQAVREFFATHGDDLADAARLMGGAAAEARAINAAVNLQTADRLDSYTRRDLHALHRLLSFDTVVDPGEADTWLYSHLDPASPAVASICFITDRLTELLEEIGELGQDRRLPDLEHTMAITRS